MTPALSALIILIGFFVLLGLGLPVVFAAGAAGIGFILLELGSRGFMICLLSVWNTMNAFVLIAVPFFIFMGAILQRSGIAEEMYETFSDWMGEIRGGLAITTVVVCTLFAAMSGVIGASIVTMAMIALPSMLNRGYSKKLAMGTIMASGSLAMLIPPSILFILYGTVAGESIGGLYLGGVFPGLILAGSYIAYIAIICWLKPELAPVKGDYIPWGKRIKGLKALIGPMFIIIIVLGSIFAGYATPSEAAALGAISAIFVAAIRRKLTLEAIKIASYETARASAMVGWIVMGAGFFSQVFALSGTLKSIQDLLMSFGISPWIVLFMMQMVLFFAGSLIDDVAIIILFAPLFVSILKVISNFDMLWFGVIFNINLQLSLLTPPFGFALFYMKGMAPPGTNMGEIYRSAFPFLIIQGLVLILSIVFPDICTWLPKSYIK